jgi:IclR family transcriptional regulator, KDG regulon repressor
MAAKDSPVRAIERALDILDCFEPGRLELTLTDIASTIHLSMSTTSRIAATLENRRFLARNADTQKYSLGARIAQIGALGLSNMELRRVALPFMRDLNALYNEGVSLYVIQDEARICIERVESTLPLRRVVNVGDRHPLTRGAAGRVLLAYLPKERRAAVLAKDPYTTDEALEELRHGGYTVSLGEREDGVSSIAAPIEDARCEVIAALSMSGPSVRFEGSGFSDKIARVKKTAEQISKAMGR